MIQYLVFGLCLQTFQAFSLSFHYRAAQPERELLVMECNMTNISKFC